MAAVRYRLRCSLRISWRASLGLALAVAVLGGTVLALGAGAARTLSAPNRYAAARGTNYTASVQQSQGRPRKRELRSLPAVADVQSVTFVFGQLVPRGKARAASVDALVFAGTDRAGGLQLVDGREPSAAGEFVASRSLVASAGLSLGDRFDLWVIPQAPATALGFDAADQSVRLLEATLVGVIDGPSELQGGSAEAIFPSSLLDAGDVGISASVIAVALTPGSTLPDLRTQLDSLANASQFGINPVDWVPTEVRTAVSAQGQGFAILALIVALATIVVLGQLLSRHVRLSRNERNVLRSQGMTSRQTVGDPVLRAAVPTVVGATLAVGGAYLASGRFPVDFVRRVEPDPGLRFETAPLLLGALALAVLVVGWVLIAILASERQRPSGRATTVEALARRAPVRIATALRFAFTHQSGDTARPRAAAVGAAAVVAVLVGALTFGVSVGQLVDRPDRWGNPFDLGLGQGGNELPRAVRAQLAHDPDLTTVTLFTTVVATVDAQSFNVTGARQLRGSLPIHVLEGRLAARPGEMIIGGVVARRLGLGVGDRIVVAGGAGRVDFRVTGLGVLPGAEGADGVGEGGLVTFAGLHRLDPTATATVAGLQLRPGARRGAARRISVAIGRTVSPNVDRPGVIVNADRIRAIPFLVAGVLGVLASLNLAHQLILSTRRRRRDLAVLRALGAGTRWITSVVHWQASLFTLVVLVLATPVGVITGRVVYRAFVARIGAVDTVAVPITLTALVFVALLVLANLTAGLSARRVRRRTPSSILADE